MVVRKLTRHMSRHHDVNWALIDQAVVSGGNFITTLFIARGLGIDEFGRFTLAWMVVLFTASLHAASIAAPMMAIGPKQEPEDEPGYYGAVILQHAGFAIVAGLIAGSLVATSAIFFPDWGTSGLALPVALATIAHQTQEGLRRYFFARGRPNHAFVNSVCRFIPQVIIVALLSTVWTADILDVLWVIILCAAFSVLIGTTHLGAVTFHYRDFCLALGRHWQAARWLTPSAALEWAAANLMIIIAGALLGVTAVGALRATQQLMGLAQIFSMAFNNAIQPQASRVLHDTGAKGLHRYILRSLTMGTGITIILILIACVAPTFWLDLVYGEKYVSYHALVWWWAGYYILSFISLNQYIALRSLEITHGIFTGRVLATIISCSLAYPLIQWWGTLGAIVAAILSLVGLVAALAYAYRRAMAKTIERSASAA